MLGQKLVNRYPNIGVAKCGTSICGVYSAQYSLKQDIKSIFSSGDRNPTVIYSEIPNIEVTFAQYLTYFDFDYEDLDVPYKIELISRDKTVVCDNAFLTRISYSFTTTGPFIVNQTYSGFTKPKSSDIVPDCIEDDEIHISHWRDFKGNLPPGISSSAISSVSVDISINRQTVAEFATRKPYASYVVYPTTSSITYECYNTGVDSYVLESMKKACGTEDEQKYNLSAGACSKSIAIDQAYLTELSYSGGDAAGGSEPQKVTVGFTSYRSIAKPVYIFPDEFTVQC